MRLKRLIIITLHLLLLASPLRASVDPAVNDNAANLAVILEHAISAKLIAGGVVVIGNKNGILFTVSRGRINEDAGSPLITEYTMFDIASLTKVVATAPAIMKLLDEDRISLLDPLSQWFPEFKDTEQGKVTILGLLTHTSGFDDIHISEENSISNAIQKLASMKQLQRPSGQFHYADINFILLGELVQRVSGSRLDAFCQTNLYKPIGTQETMFLPPENICKTIAPTFDSKAGIVQDPNARRMGGVAGHAGLFSSASDLARYARLILGGGIIDGTRVFSDRVVTQMTAPYFASGGSVVRGLGWDRRSPFSAPRGDFFSGTSFGHTGYSGSSIWIDPKNDLFVVLLTNRVNYRDTGVFNQFRRDVSTFAMRDFRESVVSLELAAPLSLVADPVYLPKIAKSKIQSHHRSKLSARLHKKKLLAKRAKHRLARSERKKSSLTAAKHKNSKRRG